MYAQSPGGTPLYKPYRYVPLQRVRFLCRFGLRTGVDFAHFRLEMGVDFEGTTGAYEHIYRLNSKCIKRKGNVRIRSGF